MKSCSGLDVLTRRECKVVTVTAARPTSTLVLDLVELPPDEKSDDKDDRLEHSRLTMRYRGEGLGRNGNPEKVLTIAGWDIAALLEGIDKLRPELARRIKSAARASDAAANVEATLAADSDAEVRMRIRRELRDALGEAPLKTRK
jgi:hypothetical protein